MKNKGDIQNRTCLSFSACLNICHVYTYRNHSDDKTMLYSNILPSAEMVQFFFQYQMEKFKFITFSLKKMKLKPMFQINLVKQVVNLNLSFVEVAKIS